MSFTTKSWTWGKEICLLPCPLGRSVKSYRTLPLFPTFRKEKFPGPLFGHFYFWPKGRGALAILVVAVLFSWTQRTFRVIGKTNSLISLNLRDTRSHFTWIKVGHGLYSFSKCPTVVSHVSCSHSWSKLDLIMFISVWFQLSTLSPSSSSAVCFVIRLQFDSDQFFRHTSCNLLW